jgi:glyoxylase-like metal-dependent hydrolase (beta-lactamase superfamily II)
MFYAATFREYFVIASLAAVMPFSAMAQNAKAVDAKPVVEDAVKAMGLGNLGSIRYTGRGLNFALGQAAAPNAPWPKFNVKTYERIIDFDAGAMRQTMVRTQGENPPHGGGQQPLIGEQTQTQVNGFKEPWTSQFEAWVTPAGFLKGAMANNATVQSKTIDGKRYNVVSYQIDKKYRINGYIDDRNMVSKVETWVDNPVLGDMPVEATYSDYKDFHGMKFPAKIVEKQGGYPVMDLTIDDANRNIAAGVQPPGKEVVQANPFLGVDEQLVAEDVYYFTGGTHHSVIVNFNDYVVVIEAPLDEARSNAVIGEVKKLYYNKPIKYLINTHAHFDHGGGLRAYAAEGATILTYQMNKPYYEKTFAMPRTLNPDKFSQSRKKAVIEAVPEKRVLTDGKHTIELYHVPNQHNEGMLIAYLPSEKILVEADLYTPAAAGAPDAAAPVSPYTQSLVDNLDRLKLGYEKILPLHGRTATKEDLMKTVHK